MYIVGVTILFKNISKNYIILTISCIIIAIMTELFLFYFKPGISQVFGVISFIATVAGFVVGIIGLKSKKQKEIFAIILSFSLAILIYQCVNFCNSFFGENKKDAIMVETIHNISENEKVKSNDETSDKTKENENEIVKSEKYYTSPEKLEEEIKSMDDETKDIEPFVPDLSKNEIDEIFVINKYIFKDDTHNPSWKNKIKCCIEDTIKKELSTLFSQSEEEINAYSEFVKLTSQANKLEVSKVEIIDSQTIYNLTPNDYIQVISLREKAYNILKTDDLSKILANNCYDYGMYLSKTGDKGESFNCLIKAIKYYNDKIKFMSSTSDKNYYDMLYKIGMVYQTIGDIEYLDKDYRQKAFITAEVYLQLATEKKKFCSYYYTGMVNHKMTILRKNNPDVYLYLNDAEKYYKKSLTSTYDSNSKSDLKMFLMDIYSYAIQYNKAFGQKKEMKSIKEYTSLINSYKEQLS